MRICVKAPCVALVEFSLKVRCFDFLFNINCLLNEERYVTFVTLSVVVIMSMHVAPYTPLLVQLELLS